MNNGDVARIFNTAGPREIDLAQELLVANGFDEAAEFGRSFEAGRVRVCEGCDCTDETPCIDERTGKPCYWVEGLDVDICSVCAPIARALGCLDHEAPALNEEPLVQLYSEGDANRAIAAARAGRA